MKSLTTTFDGVLANDGTMFDIRAFPNKSVTIRSLSFRTTEAATCDVQVFTKSGSHEYFEETRHAWTEIVNERTQCMGPEVETIIDEGTFINVDKLGIEQGEERAFYIRVDGTELIYSATASYDQVYTEDSNLQILEGTGLSNFFKDYVAARMWNGAIYYEVENTSDNNSSDMCTNVLKVDSDMSGKTNNYGLMFNIRNKVGEHIEILGLTFHSESTKKVNYNIYTVSEGFENRKTSLDPWRKVAAGGSQGGLSPIVVSGEDFDIVNIPPSERQGFFIALDTKDLIYRTTPLSMGSTYVQNELIAVTIGTGVGDPSPPLGSTFYDSRGFYGQILYRTKDACIARTTVTFNFVVHHPNNWSVIRLLEQMSESMKKTVSDILDMQEDLQELTQDHGLKVDDVLFIRDPEDESPCSTPNESIACIRVAAIITLIHERGIDDGVITVGLLENSEKATLSLNTEFLKVYYAGDEPIDTTTIITLSGVPKKRMGMKQLAYFSRQTKSFLEKHANTDAVEILSVEVEAQTLKFALNEVDANEKEVPQSRRLEEDTTSIDLETVVTGKHRPPSPGLNFDVLIEDSINADAGSFKEELMEGVVEEEGGSYFQYIDGVRSSPSQTLSPTIAPTQQVLIYEGENTYEIQGKGLGLVALVLIIVVASIMAFACVFGTFIWRRRQQEQKRFKSQEESSEPDEDDPLFYDLFQNRKSRGKEPKSSKDPTFSSKVQIRDDQSRQSDHTPDTGVLSDQSTDIDHFRYSHSYAQEVMVDEDANDDDVESFVVTSRPSVQRGGEPRSRLISSASSRCSSVISSSKSSIVSETRSTSGLYDDGRDQGTGRRIHSNSYQPCSNFTTSYHDQQYQVNEPNFEEVNRFHPHNNRREPFSTTHSNFQSVGHTDDPGLQDRWSHNHDHNDDDVASISTSSTISTQGNIPGQQRSSRPSRR